MNQIFRLLPEGRVSRSTYWLGLLVLLCLSVLLSAADYGLLQVTISENLWVISKSVIRGLNLVLLYYFIVLSMRRLHDIGRSGLWFIALFIFPPLVLILGCLSSAEGDNRYGSNPCHRRAP